MQTLWRHLSYGSRMLLKRAGSQLIAVITLTLGAGAVFGQETSPPPPPLRTKTMQAQVIARLEKSVPLLMKGP